MDEEAILELIKGNDNSEASTPLENDGLSFELNKVASMEGMPEEMAGLLKEASYALEEKEKELEYIKLAYDMANNGLVPWEGVYEKAAELKESGKSPEVIREAITLGSTFSTPFGQASDSKDNEAAKSGMYSVLTK